MTIGVLEPTVGPHGRFEFSFRDVVVLRSVRDLLDNNVPPSTIHATMRSLSRSLGEDDTLTAYRLVADGGRVVVVRGDDRWDPVTGQEVLDLAIEDGASITPDIGHITRTVDVDEGAAEEWFLVGDEAEGEDLLRAVEAYERAIVLDPRHVDARINLGRLLHASGQFLAAIDHYAAAVEVDPLNAIAWFNMGIALEDEGAPSRAIDAYLRSIESDGSLADAHHNIAVLFERTGESDRALQHLHEYHKLTK
ncbi:MAG: tetratricopeptide repeat protein [Actinomycetia bacterium]|nr:tetratricopeptide repeat protein [Actinomycetes bacterium]